MYVLCVLIVVAIILLVLNNVYVPTSEGFISFGYPWHRSTGWGPNWWSRWWHRPWYNRPYRPYYHNSCPAGCVYSGYGSNRQSGFRCLDPGANCPVGDPRCCQYDYDCNAC